MKKKLKICYHLNTSPLFLWFVRPRCVISRKCGVGFPHERPLVALCIPFSSLKNEHAGTSRTYFPSRSVESLPRGRAGKRAVKKES